MTKRHENSRHEGQPGRRRPPIEEFSPEQRAWAQADALRWRAELRSGTNGDALPKPTAPEPAPSMDEATRRSRFAAAMARAEFGRFYRAGQLERNVKTPKRSATSPRKPR